MVNQEREIISNNNNNKNTGGKNSRKQFQGTCNYCGKFSHKEADCHKKVADLKVGKTNNEAAAAAISNQVEFLLMEQESQKQGFPDNHKLLLQPSIWIGNTAVMMDMTPHAKGMVGMKKSAKTVSIVMGNKQVENSVAIGDIPGVVCNNQGNQVLPVKMTNIALVPDCAFNLFSIEIKTRMVTWGRCKCIGVDQPQWQTSNKIQYKNFDTQWHIVCHVCQAHTGRSCKCSNHK